MVIQEASIVLCTHNRSYYIDDVLTSLNQVDYPSQACEIVIVDNASTDNTHLECLKWQTQSKFPIRYIYEKELGLSNARNTGARAAKHEIVVYVDDDEFFEPEWLLELVKPFCDQRDVVCSGGRIDLHWEGQCPKWLSQELEGYLGNNRHLGDDERFLSDGEYPFGGSLAVRKGVLLQVGGFDPQFGRVGRSLGTSEEARFVDLLRPLGRIAYNPRSLVHHRVPVSRIKKNYFIRLSFFQGIANANLERLRSPSTHQQLLFKLAVDLKLCIQLLAICFLKWVSRHPDQSFSALANCSAQFGHFSQHMRLIIRKSE